MGDLLHQLSHFPYAYVVFSRITFITQRYNRKSLINWIVFLFNTLRNNDKLYFRACFWVQLIPFFGMQYSMVVILCLGLDRFYCIISPFGFVFLYWNLQGKNCRYRGVATTKRTRITYIIAVNLFPVMSSIVVATVGYIQMEERPDKWEQLCELPQTMAWRSNLLFKMFHLWPLKRWKPEVINTLGTIDIPFQ